MVIRVLVVSLVAAVCLVVPFTASVFAGASQPCYGPGYGAYCGPSYGPPSPAIMCGRLAGKASMACGMALRAPACIMSCILAPPPCRAASVNTPYVRQAACVPRKARISKCKPPACNTAAPAYYYGTWPGGCGYQYGGGPGPVLSCGACCKTLAEMPFRLVSGLLSMPRAGCYYGDYGRPY